MSPKYSGDILIRCHSVPTYGLANNSEKFFFEVRTFPLDVGDTE